MPDDKSKYPLEDGEQPAHHTDIRIGDTVRSKHDHSTGTVTHKALDVSDGQGNQDDILVVDTPEGAKGYPASWVDKIEPPEEKE